MHLSAIIVAGRNNMHTEIALDGQQVAMNVRRA
jgi:hypothetical protein